MQTVELINYEAIPETVWTMLNRAANDPSQSLRLMAVATVASTQRPSNRVLVLRGADRTSGLIWFHTDRRSPKVQHLKTHPYVSAVGYDPQGHAQIRIEGPVTLHADNALAQRNWEQVSMAVRYAYALPHGPGEPLQQPDPRTQAMSHQFEADQLDQGRRNFVVLQLQVETIDWLQVATVGQRRALLRADTHWRAEPLSP